MSESDYDNKQQDPHELVDTQKLCKWMQEVRRGQQAQMNILKYLLKRDGLRLDEGTPSTGEEGSRSPGETPEVDILVGLVHERILDEKPLPESSSPLQSPSRTQNLDLSTVEKLAELRARKPAGAGRYTSIKTSPILQTKEPKPPVEVRKSRSIPWKQKRILVKGGELDLPPRNMDLGCRKFAAEEKQCVIKAESRFGEASVYTTSSSGNIGGDLMFGNIPNNEHGMMGWLMDESSRESTIRQSTPPGHIKHLSTKLKRLQWDGKQGPLCGLNVGRRLSHEREEYKNDAICVD